MAKFRNYSNYEIYADGRIYSYKKKRFLKPQLDKYGYQTVNLYDNDGKMKTYKVHRIVWEAVTGEPIPEGMQINHRSEAKTENIISNLELVSPKENVNFGSRNARASKSLKNNPKISKAVGAFKNGELVMTFPSAKEGGRNGFNQGHISACCRGDEKTHKGFEWRYL